MYITQPKQPKLIKWGQSFFTDNERFTMSRNSFKKKVQYLLNLSELDIKDNQYYDHDWERVFSMMYKSQVTKLKLSNLTRSPKAPLFNSELLNNFIHVKFMNLKYLSFYCCHIVSIEAIAWIDAPKLQKLHFISNFINSFSALTKIKTQLKDLILYSKKPAGLDVRKLQRIKAQFSIISIEMAKNSATIVQDLSILAKLPTPRRQGYYRNSGREVIQVKIGKKKRIDQNRIKKLLNKHYVNPLDFIDSPNDNGRGTGRSMGLMEMIGYGIGHRDIAETAHYYSNNYEPDYDYYDDY